MRIFFIIYTIQKLIFNIYYKYNLKHFIIVNLLDLIFWISLFKLFSYFINPIYLFTIPLFLYFYLTRKYHQLLKRWYKFSKYYFYSFEVLWILILFLSMILISMFLTFTKLVPIWTIYNQLSKNNSLTNNYWWLTTKEIPKTSSYLDCISNIPSWKHYKKENWKVYYEWINIEWSDYDTFKIIDENSLNIYAIDKNKVYVLGVPLSRFDPNSFQVLKTPFIKDKNWVYYANFSWDWIASRPKIDENKNDYNCKDLLSWKIIKEWNNIKLFSQAQEDPFIIEKIKWLDPSTFQIVNNENSQLTVVWDLLKDKNSLYVFDYWYNLSRNKNNKLYNFSKIKINNPETFEIINKFYVKDKSAIYTILYKWFDNPKFNLLTGADINSFKILKTLDPINLSFNNSYIGITAEDNTNYYARDLVIPKNRKITQLIWNMSDTPVSCENLCKNRGLKVSINWCYDSNLKLCTVANNDICSNWNEKTIIENDYSSACCCEWASFSRIYKKTKKEKYDQTNFCISTDGRNPFVKWITRAIFITNNSINPNNSLIDVCSWNNIIDYYCSSDAWLVYSQNMKCPNWCQNWAYLPLNK